VRTTTTKSILAKGESKGLVNVYGILMSSTEEQAFAKYRSENQIAMNTKTPDERLALTLNWLEKHLSN